MALSSKEKKRIDKLVSESGGHILEVVNKVFPEVKAKRNKIKPNLVDNSTKTTLKEKPYELLEFSEREEWLSARLGRITGTRLGEIINLKGSGYKKAFWKMIAEVVAGPDDGENVMDRGLRLEEEAIEVFEKITGRKVKRGLTLCVSTENDKMAYSSDGIIDETSDIEIKCLNSASHIEALIENEIPSEYDTQILQGFIVNPKLEKRYFIFYDPRVQLKPFFFFEINRKDKEDDIEFYKEQELKLIEEANNIILRLSNF